jgi:hypothetical protein
MAHVEEAGEIEMGANPESKRTNDRAISAVE